MKRTLFTSDHDDFRAMIRDFSQREVVPVFPTGSSRSSSPATSSARWRSWASPG
jgi:hypothetical protein